MRLKTANAKWNVMRNYKRAKDEEIAKMGGKTPM